MTVTDVTDPDLALARAYAGTLASVGALIGDLAEGADLALAGGVPAKVVAYRLIDALRLVAKGVSGEPVTP